jgi:hypothetical protein
VVNPLDNSIITAYNLKSQFAGLVSNVDSTDPDLERSYNGLEININARLPHGARIFGGTSTERTLVNSCSAASRDPNLSLYCDQSGSDIPFETSLKLAGTFPLPWYGLTASFGLGSAAGSLLGSDALPYGVFTAGTGFTQPNGQGTYLQVSQATTYDATTCKSSACTIGARIIPGLTATSLNVPLVAPQTEYTPRINTVDFALNKAFQFGRVRILPKLDVFNALNSDDYTAVSTMQFATATYLRPSTILQGRIVRIGADVKW